MSRLLRERNLEQLLRNLEEYANKNGSAVPNPPRAEARRLAGSLYLANSATPDTFSAICRSGMLVSANRLAAMRGAAPDPNTVESLMGTAGSVFFYLAPFRYPSTACGLLFARSLEEEHREDGAASPFDSGGLLRVFTRPGPAETPLAFLARHELPAPDHRRYLELSLSLLFGSPFDYVEGSEPRWPGPIGLTGGDSRRWTHEVRVPEQVWVRGAHLQAAFAPRGRIAADPAINRLFEWCEREAVDRVSFNVARRDDFEALRRACVDYIRGKLG